MGDKAISCVEEMAEAEGQPINDNGLLFKWELGNPIADKHEDPNDLVEQAQALAAFFDKDNDSDYEPSNSNNESDDKESDYNRYQEELYEGENVDGTMTEEEDNINNDKRIESSNWES